MPAPLEVVCTNDACDLDTFELHYTDEVPDDVGVEDVSRPYCTTSDELREAIP